MKNQDSKQIKKVGDFVIWHSKGDNLPFWVSDLEGYEIISFKTLKQSVEWAKNQTKKVTVKLTHAQVENLLGLLEQETNGLDKLGEYTDDINKLNAIWKILDQTLYGYPEKAKK